MGKSAEQLRRVVNLGLTRPLVLLSAGVLGPVLLSSALGIVALAIGESSLELIVGILALCFAVTAIASGIVVVVWLGQRAHTARLQSDLLSNVSHELKTPLAGIRMAAQTLLLEQSTPDSETVRECAIAVDRESRWLEATVERLLAWRTAPRDRDRLEFVTKPVAETVAAVARRFAAMVPAEEVDFSASDTSTHPVRHAPVALESALLNLLVNAYKYSPGRKVIALTARDAKQGIVLCVLDQGQGIPLPLQRRIFEPFQRGRETNGTQGAGLGLAIVKAHVEAHGGRIELDSQPGRGATFSIHLPGPPEDVP